MNVNILAASDRNNYGDLLFPILLKKFINREYQSYHVRNYAIVKSDLSWFGAIPTSSFTTLIKDISQENENSLIIIGGGEVVGGGWLNIYRFIYPFWNRVYHNKYLRKLFNLFQILEKYNLYFNSSSRPFILDGDAFRKKKIIYNSVGAQSAASLLNLNENVKSYFKRVKFLSVRDSLSHKNFNAVNIFNNLVPDSALIMSDIIDNEFIDCISEKCKTLSKTNYVFLQLASNKGPADIEKFLQDVQIFADNNDLNILLCPIGLALDHGDDIILKKISANAINLQYYHPENLYEIMYLLKNARIYLGTSLHGLITAQSFGVPFYVFPEKINKLKVYIDTWFEKSEILYGSFENFEKVQLRYESFNKEEELRNMIFHKKLIYDNLRAIFS